MCFTIRLKTLSLGAHVEVAPSSSSGTPSIVTDVLVLTDHPLFPLLFSDIKFYSGGFFIFRSDIGTDIIVPVLEEIVLKECSTYNCNVHFFMAIILFYVFLVFLILGGNPMLFSMEHHIAEMWTIDASDCLSIAQSRGLIRQPSPWNLGTQDLPDPSVAEGYLLIFRFKSSDDFNTERNEKIEEKDVDSDDYGENINVRGMHRNLKKASIDRERNKEREEDIVESMTFNPLKHSLSPLCSPSSGCASHDIIEPQYLAIFVQNGSQLAAMMSSALATWRQTLRSLSIPHHKGEDSKGQGLSQTGRGRNMDGLIPSSIFRAYVAAIGTCAMAMAMTMTDSSSSSYHFSREETKYDTNSMSSSENIPLSARTILAAGTSLSALPGTGFLSMRCGLPP